MCALCNMLVIQYVFNICVSTTSEYVHCTFSVRLTADTLLIQCAHYSICELFSMLIIQYFHINSLIKCSLPFFLRDFQITHCYFNVHIIPYVHYSMFELFYIWIIKYMNYSICVQHLYTHEFTKSSLYSFLWDCWFNMYLIQSVHYSVCSLFDVRIIQLFIALFNTQCTCTLCNMFTIL